MVSGANSTVTCKICGTQTQEAFSATVLERYTVAYYSCPNCEYLCTEEPYWLDEAYKRSINIVDTGILDRNLYFSKIVSVLLYFFFPKKGAYLDYAGGYGIFTRLMRDIGFDFYWKDPYCENLVSPGFEHKKEFHNTYDAVTAFEVFEHFVDPIHEVETMMQLSKNIIFSTELMAAKVPQPENWWYYGLEHGQHVSFYSKKTLRIIARRYGLNFYSVAGIHIFSQRKLPAPVLTVLLRLAKYGLFGIIKNLIASKTWEDHIAAKSFERKN